MDEIDKNTIKKNKAIANFKLAHGDLYDYSSVVYNGSKNKVEIICSQHGSFWQTIDNHKKGKGCPKCGQLNRNKNKFKNQKHVLKKFEKIHGDRYDYSKVDYKGSNTKVSIICKQHGVFKQTPHSHSNGNGCPKCGNDKTSTLSSRKKKFFSESIEVHGDRYDYSKVDYKRSHDKVEIICDKHGSFHQTPTSHLGGNGCPKCAGEKNRERCLKTHKNVIDDFKVIHGNLYDYSKVYYNGNTTPIEIICEKHGSFHQLPNNHLKGSGCPKCVGNISKLETDLKSTIENSLCMEFEGNVRGLIPSKPKYEIDMVNTKNMISIEFNGIYWHQIKDNKNNRDLFKAECMREFGFKHIAVNETDAEKIDIICDILNPQKQVLYARKCELVYVDNGRERDFLDMNHIQGYTSSRLCLGLEHDGKLVQLMSFSKSRFDKSVEFEIVRLCTKRGFIIVGGTKKLFKHFLRINKPKSIVSFSDNRFFSGNVYDELGFKFLYNTNPNYIWFKPSTNSIFKRYKTMKGKLKNLLGDYFDDSLSESENMRKAGYHKIMDYGNKKWLWTN